MPIGRFARLCRLSVKQLRHYDELGLLRPARVDPATGYRYYRAAQARDALAIALLRSLDISLADIGRVLAGGDVAGVLGAARDRMEAELVRRRGMLATLERLLADGMPRPQVRLARERARQVAVVRDAGADVEIGVVTSRAAARLNDALAAAGRVPEGPLVGVFPLDVGEQVAITLAAPLTGELPGLDSGVLAGGCFAVATHAGPYEQISLTAHAVLAWIGEHGHTPAGEVREVYVSDPRSTPPDRLVTQLMIRIQEDG